MTPTEVSFDPAVSAIRLVEDVDFNDISSVPSGGDDALIGLLDSLVAPFLGSRDERYGRFEGQATLDEPARSLGFTESVAPRLDPAVRRRTEDAQLHLGVRRRIRDGCQCVSQRELIDFAHHCLRTGQDTGLAFEALRVAERRTSEPRD